MKAISQYIFLFMFVFMFTACAQKQEGDTVMQSAEPEVRVSPLPATEIFSEEELSLVAQGNVAKKPKLEKDIMFVDAKDVLVNINSALEKEKANEQNTVSLLGMRALVHSQLNNSDAAFDDITNALRQGASPKLYAIRSLILWRSGKMRGALLDADYALKKQGNLALAHMAKGLALFGNEKKEESCDWLEDSCNTGLCYGLEYVKQQGLCQ